MKTNSTVLAFTVAAAFLSSPFENALGQQTRDQLFIGARPIAMGETFVAIADDGTAMYWNPAGLPYLRKYEINFAYANLLGVGLNNAYLSLFAPVTRRFVLGADWFRLGFDDVANDTGLEFSQNLFHFSFAYKLLDNLSIGANFKYVNMDGSEDQVAVGKADGTGYDVGLLFSPSDWLGVPFDKLRFGVMVHDVTDTDVTFDNGVSDTILKRNIRYGVSYRPRNNLVLGLDVDDRLHFGTEYWLFNTLALRGGWQKDRHTSESAIFSFGLGLARNLPALERVQTNYAFIDHPAALNTNQFSAGIAFELFPKLIEIVKIEMGETFASLYKHHSKFAIGKAYVKYNGKDRLRCDVTASTSTYSPTKGYAYTAVLTPSDSLHVLPVQVVFQPLIIDQTETIPLSSSFDISYSSRERRRHEHKTSKAVNLYGRGMIDWSKGTAQAAAFIDPDDEAINTIAHAIIERFEGDPETTIPSDKKLSHAIQIFKALGEAGIHYVKDSESPYAKASKGLDKIYYPVETLNRQIGDCDDTSILYATLLESLDIPTALVAVPGHLLIIFDTGILQGKRSRLVFDEKMYIPLNGSYWIPVETTLLAEKSLWNAWQTGIQIIRTKPLEEVVELQRAWQTYEPVASPAKLKTGLSLKIDHNDLPSPQDATLIKKVLDAEIQKLEQQLAQHPNDLDLRKKLALKYARWPWRGDRLDSAKEQYRKILARSAASEDSFAVYNDLANLYLLQEKARLDSADSFYTRAITIARRIKSPDIMGIHLNRGALFLAAGQEGKADSTYGLVVHDSTGLAIAEHYLEIKLGAQEDSARADQPRKRVNQEKVKQKIKISKGKGKRGEEEVRFVAGSAPAEISGWEIDDVFYWAIKPKDDK